MGFKTYDRNMSFADMEMDRVMGSSRTQRFLKEIDDHISWMPIEKILLKDYPVGKFAVGNAAYPPLMLLKAVFLQKWFRIKSDPELENQINNRISFKTFIWLPLADPSPDHSVVSRFRDRVGQETMESIHREVLQQLERKGFSIDAGMVVDARLIKSASRPVSRKKMRKLVEKKIQEKKKNPGVKFQRDTDSDWTVKNDKPYYGMKEHAYIDVRSGLVLSSVVSKASVHDSTYFQDVVFKGIHDGKVPGTVYADKGYHDKMNREFLSIKKISDGIMRKDEQNAKITEMEITRNRMISNVRYKIEQYSGLTALHDVGKARFTTLVKENWNHLFGAIAFNMKRSFLLAQKQQVYAVS